MMFFYYCSKVNTALQPEGVGLQRVFAQLVVDDDGIDVQGKVVGDVELGERGIDIGIDDGDGIDADEDEETHVAPTAETVFPRLEEFLVSRLVRRVDLHSQMHELVVAVGLWVVVEQVHVGL